MTRRAIALLLLPFLAAQTPPDTRTLAELQRAFAAQREAQYSGDKAPTREQEQELLKRQLDELAAFVEHEAKGDDRFDGQVALCERALQLRQKDRALAACKQLDRDGVPVLTAMTGAELAVELGEKALHESLVLRALKAAGDDVVQQLQIARILMTRLRDVPRGEQLVAAALAAAKDDDQRALVRWYECEAIREREDLPENSYYEALEKLGTELPKTYWGSVARDRNLASQFAIGTRVFDFTATAVDGTKVTRADLDGRAAALVFCAITEPGSESLFAALLALSKAADTLSIVVIATDADAKAATAAAEKLGKGLRVVCDGRGLRGDLLLRFHVEAVPTVIALDGRGNIAGLNLHVETRDARAEFDEAMARALQKAK